MVRLCGYLHRRQAVSQLHSICLVMYPGSRTLLFRLAHGWAGEHKPVKPAVSKSCRLLVGPIMSIRYYYGRTPSAGAKCGDAGLVQALPAFHPPLHDRKPLIR